MSADQPQAVLLYPGIETAWFSCEGTDKWGVSPTQFTVDFFPQNGIPAISGNLVLKQGTTSITFANCQMVDFFFKSGSGGSECRAIIYDERWRWLIGYVISGTYNLRLPNNQRDTIQRPKALSDLVNLLFAAMNVTNYDASILKTTAFATLRPYVNWDVANPAQELQKLLDENGLTLAPKRSNGTWVVCQIGTGANLPPLDGSIPYQDPGLGVNPKEVPDGLRVYGAPIRYQVRLQLEAIGKDILNPANAKADGTWKPISELSYIPYSDDSHEYTWVFEDEDMENVSPDRILQPDGSYQVARDLARSTVLRTFRVVSDQDGNIQIPGYVSPVDETNNCTLDQLIFHPQLVDSYTDADGTRYVVPAFCDFVGTHKLLDNSGVNTVGGTRLEVQSNTETDAPDDFVTFSLNTDNVPFHLLTSPHGIVTFSQQLRKWQTFNNYETGYVSSENGFPASVWLNCTVNVRDPNTWQPIRYTKTLMLPGANPNSTFIEPLRHDDIQQWFKTTYQVNSDGTVSYSSTTNNLEYVEPQADYYLNSVLQSYETPLAQTITYQVLLPMDLDGALQQASYSISRSGVDTKVSRGTEHDFHIPSYREQIDRIQRSGLANASLQTNLNLILQNIPTI